MLFKRSLSRCYHFSVYNTCTLPLNNKINVINLDAPGIAILGTEPSSEMLNTTQSQKLE